MFVIAGVSRSPAAHQWRKRQTDCVNVLGHEAVRGSKPEEHAATRLSLKSAERNVSMISLIHIQTTYPENNITHFPRIPPYSGNDTKHSSYLLERQGV